MLSLFVFWVQCSLMTEKDETKGVLLQQVVTHNVGF